MKLLKNFLAKRRRRKQLKREAIRMKKFYQALGNGILFIRWFHSQINKMKRVQRKLYWKEFVKNPDSFLKILPEIEQDLAKKIDELDKIIKGKKK